MTSEPETHVVRAQVDPIFMSSPHNWADDYVVLTQVAPVLLGSKKPGIKLRVNLCTYNMIKKHL